MRSLGGGLRERIPTDQQHKKEGTQNKPRAVQSPAHETLILARAQSVTRLHVVNTSAYALAQ